MVHNAVAGLSVFFFFSGGPLQNSFVGINVASTTIIIKI